MCGCVWLFSRAFAKPLTTPLHVFKNPGGCPRAGVVGLRCAFCTQFGEHLSTVLGIHTHAKNVSQILAPTKNEGLKHRIALYMVQSCHHHRGRTHPPTPMRPSNHPLCKFTHTCGHSPTPTQFDATALWGGGLPSREELDFNNRAKL